MTQSEPVETLTDVNRPLTLQERRTIQEMWRKVNGIKVQLERFMAGLDIRIH